MQGSRGGDETAVEEEEEERDRQTAGQGERKGRLVKQRQTENQNGKRPRVTHMRVPAHRR